MNPIRPLQILTLLLASIFLSACENEAEPDLRAAYEQLWTHIDIREGEKAVAYLAPQSITQYDQWLQFARAGTRAQVLALNPAERSEILTMRHRLSSDELTTFDGRAYIVYAIGKGWWGRTTDTARIELGKIRFGATTASAELIVDGERSSCTCNFDLIDDIWKLDWTGFDELYNSSIGRVAEEFEISENDIIIGNEEEESGYPVPDSIWDR